jgi:hypothetical protein
MKGAEAREETEGAVRLYIVAHHPTEVSHPSFELLRRQVGHNSEEKPTLAASKAALVRHFQAPMNRLLLRVVFSSPSHPSSRVLLVVRCCVPAGVGASTLRLLVAVRSPFVLKPSAPWKLRATGSASAPWPCASSNDPWGALPSFLPSVASPLGRHRRRDAAEESRAEQSRAEQSTRRDRRRDSTERTGGTTGEREEGKNRGTEAPWGPRGSRRVVFADARSDRLFFSQLCLPPAVAAVGTSFCWWQALPLRSIGPFVPVLHC